MKDYESAFPVFDSVRADTDHQCIDPGISLRRYAAIHLKVPRSGDEELDDVIRQSQRAEFAKAAMTGIIKVLPLPGEKDIYNYSREQRLLQMKDNVFDVADAMLAEWEKEAVK